jgi:hypothetical protein
MSESIHPEIIILEDEMITYVNEGTELEVVHTGAFQLKQDETLCQADQNETPTTPQIPFLYNLIQQAVEYPQHLQRMIAEAPPEERAVLHTFFLKTAVARREVS